MCEESSEWMKLGGKPFFCFSVLGFLGRGRVQAPPPWPDLGAVPGPCPPSAQAHPPPSPGPPPHSLGGVPTLAEGEALDAATDLQGWGREGHESPPHTHTQPGGAGGGRAHTNTLESWW